MYVNYELLGPKGFLILLMSYVVNQRGPKRLKKKRFQVCDDSKERIEKVEITKKATSIIYYEFLFATYFACEL